MSKVIFVLLSLVFATENYSQENAKETVDYNQVSEDLLKALKNGDSPMQYKDIIESTSFEDLQQHLKTDAEKFAFWINIYNSYIILILQEHPEYYEDRKKFFKAKYITIGGRNLAFADIEHGIIRRSQWDLGLGLIKKPFPGKWEKKLRIKKRDYRVHFALNCGAKACPPVTVYDPINLDKQLNFMTQKYLSENTTYDNTSNVTTTTPLFSWFRGDFGCKKGVKKILANQKLIPSPKVKLKYKGYDWSLDIDNFVVTPFERSL